MAIFRIPSDETSAPTEGTGQDQVTRQANRTRLQSWLDNAATNGEIAFLDGDYEFEGDVLDIRGDTGFILTGAGAGRCSLIQFSATDGVLLAGGLNNNGTSGQIVEKMTLKHDDTVTPGNGGYGLRVNFAWRCEFSNLAIANNEYGLMKDPTSGVWMFSNLFENIYIRPYTKGGIYMKTVGAGSTGSVFNNIYVSNGPSDIDSAATASVVPVWLEGFSETTINQLNIEWVKCNTAMRIWTMRQLVINGLHIEGFAANAASAEFINMDFNGDCTMNGVNFGGNYARSNEGNSGDDAKFALFRLGSNCRLVVNGLYMGSITRDSPYQNVVSLIDNVNSGGNSNDTASIRGVYFQTNPTHRVDRISSYTMSQERNPLYDFEGKMHVSQQYTWDVTDSVYTPHQHGTDITVPALTSDLTITLSKFYDEDYSSINSAVNAPGFRVRFRRGDETNNKICTIKNHDGTVLGYLWKQNMVEFVFNSDDDWEAVMPSPAKWALQTDNVLS